MDYSGLRGSLVSEKPSKWTSNSTVVGNSEFLASPFQLEFAGPGVPIFFPLLGSPQKKIDRFPILFGMVTDGPLRNSASSGSPNGAWHFSETANGGPHRGHAQQAELHVHVAEGLGTSDEMLGKCWKKPWENGGRWWKNVRKMLENVGTVLSMQPFLLVRSR